jgi:hypothetical protein
MFRQRGEWKLTAPGSVLRQTGRQGSDCVLGRQSIRLTYGARKVVEDVIRKTRKVLEGGGAGSVMPGDMVG